LFKKKKTIEASILCNVFIRNYVRIFYVKNFRVEILKRDLYGDFFNNDQRRNKNV